MLTHRRLYLQPSLEPEKTAVYLLCRQCGAHPDFISYRQEDARILDLPVWKPRIECYRAGKDINKSILRCNLP
ncbi:MAG: hypothetical protein CVV06_15770 [Gammaproteobacteria bacterium HGW-Gammaproteobacteria-10]|nr:MAG: hypothetical protein CVV06_15770 [Gammaproteobacteria bacterium HGW-Gammaproteobacteria-10]